MNGEDAVRIAKEAFSSSTSFLDTNYRNQWATNLNLWQSKHPSKSKYHSDAYKFRSKIFRPKTRSAGRRLEAAAAAAFFSNLDVVNVEAANPKSEKASVGASVRKALLQHRLTKTIPWFVTLIGAVQDAYTIGVVCSYQSWKYKERTLKEILLDEQGIAVVDLDGQPVFKDVIEVVEDEPCIELLAVENIRISPAAKWNDPIGTSPYVIELIPMYVCDVREMMRTDDPKTGTPAWRTLTDDELRSASTESGDATRQVREGKREDSQNPNAGSLTEHEIVWIHRNIFKSGGEDWIFYTAGVEHLLSQPKRLREVYLHGERPYVMGVAQIETHKVFPESPAGMGEGLQRELNEIVNSRLDNVKLVLNKRYFGKRGAQIDLKSLVRNAAGSVTLMNNPKEDVVPIEFSDVTASAYQEQDRLNIEHDDLIGNFSQSSVMTNRKLNETVGGMGLLSGSANQVTEYTIRTITETWVEPVLRQLSMLEAAYETDEVILALVGEQAELPEGQSVTNEMMNEDITLTVNVGMGATDPTFRLNKIMVGVNASAQASQVPGLKQPELQKEIWAAVGYRDGGRFVAEEEDQSAQLQQMQQMIQKLQQELQKAGIKLADKSLEQNIKVETAKQNLKQSAEEHQLTMGQQLQEFMMEMKQDRAQFVLEMRQSQEEAEERMRQLVADGANKRELAKKAQRTRERAN